MKELYDFLIWSNKGYSNVGSRIDFDFQFVSNLEKKALLTDVMSQGHLTEPFGLIVSKKFKDFMSNFNMCTCIWYEVKLLSIKRKEIPEEYFFMYPLRLTDIIDFTETSKAQVGKILYNNEAEYLNCRLKYFKIRDEYYAKKILPNGIDLDTLNELKKATDPQKLILNEIIEDKYDFFGFKYDYHWYISERMKEAFEGSNLTGFEIVDLDVNDKILEVKSKI